MKRFLSIIALAASFLTASAQENNVLKIELPTMGWSSWNTYGFNISENIIKSQTKAMANKGYKGVVIKNNKKIIK